MCHVSCRQHTDDIVNALEGPIKSSKTQLFLELRHQYGIFQAQSLSSDATATPRTMGLRWWKLDLYVTFTFGNCLNLLSIRQSV